MYTPENIKHLNRNEVFVYGSNQYANHAGGAAKLAVEKFGAINGVAPTGLCGQSYGIITTSFNDTKVQISHIIAQLMALYAFAKLRPDLTFYVTKIGCGIAGFSIEIMSDTFSIVEEMRPNNIILPKEFSKN